VACVGARGSRLREEQVGPFQAGSQVQVEERQWPLREQSWGVVQGVVGVGRRRRERNERRSIFGVLWPELFRRWAYNMGVQRYSTKGRAEPGTLVASGFTGVIVRNDS